MKNTAGLLHIVLFPFPQHGHVNPMLQLALHLTSRGIIVTFVNTERSQQKLQLKHSDVEGLHFATIPDGLPWQEDQDNATFDDVILSGSKDAPALSKTISYLFQTLPEQAPHLENLLLTEHEDRPRASCLISDAFMPWVERVARRLKLSWMVFWSASATRLYLTLNVAEEASDSDPYSVIKVPGLPEVDFPPAQNSYTKPQRRENVLRRVNAMKQADVVLVNTCDAIENKVTTELSRLIHIRSIGPLCQPHDSHKSSLTVMDKDCIAWLDTQAPCSVLYVSFGSKIILQGDKLKQLALGIEASGKTFLWVIRSTEKEFLETFMERTKKGRLVEWAPQQCVLAHPSVGAFLTHCGWNSVLEALLQGLPMVCWPVFADQPTNRILIEKQWKIGKGFDRDDVSPSEIGETIEQVMNDEVLRCEAASFAKSARSAMECGSSSESNITLLISELHQQKF